MFTAATDGPTRALFVGLTKKGEFYFSHKSPKWIFLVGGGSYSPRVHSRIQAERASASLDVPILVS